MFLAQIGITGNQSSREAMNTIAAVRLWNERFMGEKLVAANLHSRRPKDRSFLQEERPSLAQIGITGNQSSREAMNTIAAVRLWNERFMGEKLAVADVHSGRPRNKMVLQEDHFTIAQIGITKNQSSRFQALAGIPLEAFTAADAR